MNTHGNNPFNNRPISVYLGGPMTGIKIKDARAWREKAANDLECTGRIITYSPLMGEAAGSNENEECFNIIGKSENKPINQTSSFLCMQDLLYIDRCEILLFNLMDVHTSSQGSMLELGYGFKGGKYIVTAVNPESVHNCSFVRRLSNVYVPTLDEAIEALRKLVDW